MWNAINALDEDGFVLLRKVFESGEVAAWIEQLDGVFQQSGDVTAALLRRAGNVYAARNVLEWFPASRTLWRTPLLLELLRSVLGSEFGLVRALYFDKPPDKTWALPWHKDLTIAVREHGSHGVAFTHPTRKAGVPHVEAPIELLERMLTLRIHFDPATDENGPLRVLPGSHRHGKAMDAGVETATTILASPGDVLAMRPLVAHASGASHPATTLHRRILHLEFAADSQLGEGLAWHTFLPGVGDERAVTIVAK